MIERYPYDKNKIFGLHKSNTYGPELWDTAASTFESGTYAWVNYGTNTIANVSKELEITYVDNAGGAYVFLNDAADLSSDLVVDEIYKLTVDAYINTGSAAVLVNNGIAASPLQNITTAQKTLVFYFTAKSAVGALIKMQGMGAGEKVYIDNLSIKQKTSSNRIII